jgi:hypothetical protein
MEKKVIILEEGVFKTLNIGKGENPSNIAITQPTASYDAYEFKTPTREMRFIWYWPNSQKFLVKIGDLTISESSGNNVFNNCVIMNHFVNLTDEELHEVILLKQEEQKTKLEEEIEALKNELSGLKKKKKSFIQLNSEFEKVSNLINDIIKE